MEGQKKICSVCQEKENLVLCLECSEYFCNNNTGESSHIITHMIKNKHKSIRIKETICCSVCKNENFFRLGINLDGILFCRMCAVEEWKYVIEEKCIIDELISSKEIKSKKEKFTKEDYSNIIKVPIKFKDADEHALIFSKLLEEEAAEEKMIKESYKEDNLTIYFENEFIKFKERSDSEFKIIKGDEIILEKDDYKFNGFVTKKKNEIITLKLKKNLVPISNSLFNKSKMENVTLKFIWKEVGYSRMNYALQNFRKFCSKSLFKSIMNGTNETHSDVKIDCGLNKSQELAVKAALTRNLTLIQGPPGTGKTKTSAHIVKELVAQGNKVLVVAPSNTAVDQLTLEISKLKVKVLRILSKNRENSECLVEKLCLHTKMKEVLKNENEKIKNHISTYNYDELEDEEYLALGREILKSAEVVACTCITAGSPLFNKSKFTAVLIDEAVQATEPMSLVPLLYKCKKLILVGDHKQLGPTVMSKKAKYGKLHQSLFERLLLTGMTPYLLNTQYRMHPELIGFPNKVFYDNKVISGTNLVNRNSFMNPTFFHCSFQKEEISPSGTSFLNRGEANVAREMVKYLNNNGIKNSQIGIITFYEGQRCYLSELIKDVEITNVDGFQGREKDFIILSLVRSNESQGVGFIKDKRRMNVALTRAKYGLIVIGNPFTIKKDPLWNDFLQIYDERKLLFEGKVGLFKKFNLAGGIFNFKALTEELDAY